MPGRIFTTETRVPPNKELNEYLNEFAPVYNKIIRYVWRARTSPDFKGIYKTEAKFVTHVCQKFKILKRTANSINFDVKGRIRALTELKKTELAQLNVRIADTEDRIAGLRDYINSTKPLVAANRADEKTLAKYRKAKQQLYWRQNKLNAQRQRRDRLAYEIKNHILKIGFGGRKIFEKQHHLTENGYKTHEKWRNDYRRERDRNIFWLGSSDESFGNQMFQMQYRPDTDTFAVMLRKEEAFCRGKQMKDKFITIPGVRFRYMGDHLAGMLEQRWQTAQPVSCRFHRRKKRWYLQVMFSIIFDDYETASQCGTIGLDYNDGFIEAAETDEHGNLLWQQHYELRHHGTGNAAESEIREAVCHIANHAKRKGKDICAENLDFRRKKAAAQKGSGRTAKRRNRMIHAFDYSRYTETLKNCCHRKRVRLVLVNPYNTSKIGRQKYSFRKKLTVHQAAAYVIARRGQGYKDKLTA